MNAASLVRIEKRTWLLCSVIAFFACSIYLRDWPMTFLVRLAVLPLVALIAAIIGLALQFLWRFLDSALPPPPPNSPKQRLLIRWAGVLSVGWMTGIYEFLEHAPVGFLPDLDLSHWPALTAFMGIWLGIGLALAVSGLRCRSLVGRLCAIAGICVFVYFAGDLLFPRGVPGARARGPNDPVRATAAAPFAYGGLGGSLLLGFVLTQSPAPVPDFLRWAISRAL
jgi:hypothetical protein